MIIDQRMFVLFIYLFIYSILLFQQHRYEQLRRM